MRLVAWAALAVSLSGFIAWLSPAGRVCSMALALALVGMELRRAWHGWVYLTKTSGGANNLPPEARAYLVRRLVGHVALFAALGGLLVAHFWVYGLVGLR